MPSFTAAIGGIAAVAITFTAISPALAATTAGSVPINVVTCEQSSFNIPAALDSPTSPIQYENLRIAFVNQGPMQATKVRFAVVTRKGTQMIDDAGTFKPGARTTHNFYPTATGENFADTTKCQVQSVTFSDGSTWQPS